MLWNCDQRAACQGASQLLCMSHVAVCWLTAHVVLQSDRHRAAGGDTEPSRLHTEPDSEPDHDDKYVKRTSSVKRSLQRVMPTIFQPSLPVTTRY